MASIIDILDELGISHRGAGHRDVRQGWVGLACPWCGRGGDKFYLGVNLASGYAACWACGHHRLGDVLAEASGRPLRDVLPLLKELDRDWRLPEAKPRGRLGIPLGVGPLLPAHLWYLKRRGFNPNGVVSIWKISGIDHAARLPWRLWIPIIWRGETVSWTTRGIGNRTSRYVSARPDEEALPAKDLLYGADMAGGSVVVVEGPLDAWAVGPGAVATLGVGWSAAQAAALGRYARRTVCYDAEPAAQRRARALAEELKMLPGETAVARLEHGKDPADCLLTPKGRDELAALRQKFLG